MAQVGCPDRRIEGAYSSVGPMPGQDHPIKLQNLLFEAEQVSVERGKARTGNLGHLLVARVGNNKEQFCDPSA
jgi:hypothetical protein